MKLITIAISAAMLATAPAEASERRHEYEARMKNARDVHFTNNCGNPVRLAMRYRDMHGQWVTGGWWQFAGRDDAYLTRSSTGRRVATDHNVVYYYAETTRGQRSTWSGGYRNRLGGTMLNMKEKRLRERRKGTYALRISCD